uniref:Peptidase S41 n=1 Tax=Solibacter usitatus (strain Ellin6076) TaxID=234267 RepID=Q02AR6_SOLUE
MSHRTWAIVLAIAGAAAAAAQNSTSAANVEAFEKVWSTIRDKHWDPKLGGVDWQATHDELRPKVEAAKSDAAVREILNEMVGRLKQTHFGIFPGDVYHDLDASGEHDSGDADIGIDLRVIDGRALVTEVYPASPAGAKGVKPGWAILRIGAHDVAPVVSRIREQFADSSLLDLRLNRAVVTRLQGSEGSAVMVEFLDGSNRKIAVDLVRAAPRGKLARLGNLPPTPTWSEWRRLPQDIGYVRFNIFLDPDGLAKTMEEAMKGCRDCRGFVLDLRGNPGGIGGLAMGVAGWFTDKSGQQLGTEYLRGMTLKFVIFPRPRPFLGPLAVLVDGCSASTSEILAGGLKDIGRARLFGTRTAAAALPSVIDRLPNGDGFQYAIANYISQGGKPLEGLGAIPDQEVRLTREQLLQGKDPALDAAVTWIQEQKK